MARHAGKCLYPTSFVKAKGIGKRVAMLTDGRYSGGSSGLAHRPHGALRAANKGPVALIRTRHHRYRYRSPFRER